jgi:hypothetical protein
VNVVVLLERVDQPQDLLRLALVVDPDRRLRDQRQLGALDREPRALHRFAHGAQVLGGRADLPRRAVALDVVGAALRRSKRQLVLVCAAVDDDDAPPLEQPRDRARFAEVPVVLRKDVAHFGRGAVAVVGQRLGNHCDTAGCIALVDDRLERGSVGILP